MSLTPVGDLIVPWIAPSMATMSAPDTDTLMFVMNILAMGAFVIGCVSGFLLRHVRGRCFWVEAHVGAAAEKIDFSSTADPDHGPDDGLHDGIDEAEIPQAALSEGEHGARSRCHSRPRNTNYLNVCRLDHRQTIHLTNTCGRLKNYDHEQLVHYSMCNQCQSEFGLSFSRVAG